MAETCEACWVDSDNHQAGCPTLLPDYPAKLAKTLREYDGSIPLKAAQLIERQQSKLDKAERMHREAFAAGVAHQERANALESRLGSAALLLDELAKAAVAGDRGTILGRVGDLRDALSGGVVERP